MSEADYTKEIKMATYTNSSAGAEKVMFKVAGKQYGVNSGEGDVFDTPTSTSYPFDEIIVAAGATVDLGNVTWQKSVAFVTTPAAASRVGTGGDIPNNGANVLKVMFKVNGKQYNVGFGEGDVVDTETATSYPFDEAFVPVGATFNSTGTTVLKTIDLVPGPASGYTPGSD